MKFSVLMSIYHRENPSWFNRAMQSIWDEQTVKPDEIVLVQDGPLTAEISTEISKWQMKLGNNLKCVPLEKNIGLGEALNIGLRHCSNELVARMDTDDISLPQRFEKQLLVFEYNDIDVCSAWISEFEHDEINPDTIRKVPEKHDDIVLYAKYRSPINHIPVMFKKAAVLNAGGYKHMLWLEDYYLWVRMILSGARFYNIQEPLANIRAGEEQLVRRSGWGYAKSELALFKQFRILGFLSIAEFVKVSLLRLPVRLMPKSIIKFVYKQLR